MAECTSQAAEKDVGSSVAGSEVAGSGDGGTNSVKGNGKIAFVTGITGQVSCEASRWNQFCRRVAGVHWTTRGGHFYLGGVV